jgi:hypothetical protein
MTVDLHREWGSVDRFGDPDWRTDFTPDRIAIVARDGTTIAERADPRAAFTGHTLTTPWDPLHRGYVNGYALWNYMTTPFVLADPELKSWRSLQFERATRRGAVCGRRSLSDF